MFGFPWWAWLLVLVPLIVAALFWWAWKGYRRDVRRGFVEYLKERDPSAEIVIEHEGCIVTRGPDGAEAQFYLNKIYNAVAAAKKDTPETRREIYQQFYDSLMEHMETAQAPLDAETHGDRIMPRLVRHEMLEALQRQAPVPHLKHAELGLAVVYVLDAENSVMYLTQNHVNDLGLGLEGLHEQALANLRKTFARGAVQGVIEQNALVMIKSLDTYDAARVLLVPENLDEGQEIVALIPDRETLALIPLPEDDDWTAIRKLAKVPGSEHLLLDKPLRVTREGFTVV